MRSKYLWLAFVVFVVIAFDQLTKYLALQHLTTAMDAGSSPICTFYGSTAVRRGGSQHFHLKDPLVLHRSFMQLHYAENPGAAFGFLSNLSANVRVPLFHVVAIAAVIFLFLAFSRLQGTARENFARWGFALVLGGALGNYIDRLTRGFVIDFMEPLWDAKPWWPAFNVADCAIVIGVGLLIIDSFTRRESKQQRKARQRLQASPK